MYTDGRLLTAGEKTRLHSDPFGVRTYVPEKCCQGYTLFSPAWGDQEYLIDMRGLVVHTWKVTHSNVAELLPNGNLFTHNCGRWLEELTPDSKTVWRWGEDRDLMGGCRLAGREAPGGASGHVRARHGTGVSANRCHHQARPGQADALGVLFWGAR